MGNTIYAREDRETALQEARLLQKMYEEAAGRAEDGDAVRSRVGQRVRELRIAVERMCEAAEKKP